MPLNSLDVMLALSTLCHLYNVSGGFFSFSLQNIIPNFSLLSEERWIAQVGPGMLPLSFGFLAATWAPPARSEIPRPAVSAVGASLVPAKFHPQIELALIKSTFWILVK